MTGRDGFNVYPPLRVYNTLIYLIVEERFRAWDEGCIGSVSPVALLVCEGEESFLFPLREGFTAQDLEEMFSSDTREDQEK